MKRRIITDNSVGQDGNVQKKSRIEAGAGASSAVQKSNWSVQAGYIIKVRLKNFMNHAEYEYRPTERLNFINGSNGSGKSAVLTAIVFGLGGSARMTNRGTANSGLIRQGQSSTTVEISLYNGGENTYKPEVYGETITVVRTAMASGSGSYKLKDERGRIVRDKKVKEELERILSCFSIQVENPIAILHQDAAKTFLYKCDASKLYEFFMKATQLEDCKIDYNLANCEKEKSKHLLEDKIVSLGNLKTEVEKWEKKFKFLQNLEKRREMLDKWRAELSWSMVKQVRDEFEKAEKYLGSHQTKINYCKQKIEEETEKQRNAKLEKRDIERQIQEMAKESDNWDEAIDGLRTSARKAREAERNIKKSVLELNRKKKNKTDQVEALQAAITKIRSGESEREYELAMERKQNEVKKLENEKADMEAQMTTRQTHMTNLRTSLEASRSQHDEIRAKIVETKSRLERKSREISSMEKRRDNKLFLFGEKMPQFVDMIKANAKRFKTMPIGPVGFHVELVKDITKEEAAIIENELRDVLITFIVSSYDDCRILQDISQRCNIRIPIVTTHFADAVYDVSRWKCSNSKYKTILDCLAIDNHNITNYLIDAKGIETVLIIPDDGAALRLLSNIETVPENLKYALTYAYGKYHPAPHCRSYSTKPGKNVKLVLQSSVEQLIERLGQECLEDRASLEEAQRELKECLSQKIEHERQWNMSEKLIKELGPKVVKINSQIARIRSEETTSKPPDISALEDDMEAAQEAAAELEESIKKLVDQHDTAVEESRQLSEALAEKEAEVQDRRQQVDPLNEKLTSIERQIIKLEKNKENFHGKMKEYSKSFVEAQNTVARKKAKLDQLIEKASKWSTTEVETDRKPEAIHRDITVLEESLKRQECQVETKEEVAEKYGELKIFYEQVERQVRSLKDTIDHLERMLKLRKKGFLAIRGSVSRRIQMNFVMRLSTRKFIGELVFNHKENTLTITVCPEGGDVIRKRDMKGLSGGEKSFSTISLILAMWDVIQPPFRCLDEFDVFMDSVNRRISIDLITAYAKDARKFQYIFLTPLSIESVGVDEDIQIVQIQKNSG